MIGDEIRDLTTDERDYVLKQIRFYGKCDAPSEIAIKAVYILSRIHHGLHHCPKVLKKVKPEDWDQPYYFECQHYDELATCDGGELTTLVILAHDLGVRVAVEGVGPNYMRLIFHPRKSRDGRMDQRHPSIEESVERVRAYVQEL